MGRKDGKGDKEQRRGVRNERRPRATVTSTTKPSPCRCEKGEIDCG